MTDRLDAMVAREYTDKNGERRAQWTKIGAAWPRRDGGWNVVLDALPLPEQGEKGVQARIMLMPPKQQEQRQKAPASAHPQSFESPLDLDDEVPF